MKSLRGGTFVGFIIGLLVGLGVALAVAVYVAKVPMPFNNRTQPRTPDQDAAEARKNKDWDPNAPLAGKNPARPASSASVPASAPAVVGAVPAPAPVPATPASSGRAAASPGPTAPAVSADPLGDLARARAGTPAADPFLYFVQAGAYRVPEDAENQRAKLMLLGVEGKVTEREQSGRTVYRVRVGPFERKEDADRLKERLDGQGFDSALVRVQR